jgi:hypothetical protein
MNAGGRERRQHAGLLALIPCPCGECPPWRRVTRITVFNHHRKLGVPLPGSGASQPTIGDERTGSGTASISLSFMSAAALGSAVTDAVRVHDGANDEDQVDAHAEGLDVAHSVVDDDDAKAAGADAMARSVPIFTPSPDVDVDVDVVRRLVLNLLDKHVQNFDSQGSFDDSMKIIKKILGPHLPDGIDAKLPSSYRQARRYVDDLFDSTVRYDCCPNGCTLYYGADRTRTRCAKPSCNEPRLTPGGKPRKSFYYYPLIPRLRKLFADPRMAELVRHPAERWIRDPAAIRDVYDGRLWRERFVPMLGRLDPRHLAFSLTLDGVCVIKKPKHEL